MRTNQLPYQRDEAWISVIERDLNDLYGLSFPDDNVWEKSEVKRHAKGFTYRNYTLRNVPINTCDVTDATIRITVHLIDSYEYYTPQTLPHVFIQSNDGGQKALFRIEYAEYTGGERYIRYYRLNRSLQDYELY